MIVYIYTFPNGKKYIGQTTQTLEKRAKNGKGYQTQLVGKAIEKYGWENVEKEIFECATQEEMDVLEQVLIRKYKTQDRDYGYNLDSGGNVNKQHSEETKKKISDTKKGVPSPLKGVPRTEETKAKISAAKKGRAYPESGKEKLSKLNGSPVICLETKEIFDSTGLAAKAIGLKRCTCVTWACTGRVKTAGGFHWMYLSEYKEKGMPEDLQ